MTRLVADMNETQGYIPNTDVAPGFYLLDSETIGVGPGLHANGNRLVTRALAGTAAAPHRAGARLHTVEDPDADVGGVTPAAFVEPTTATPEQICDALIAAGLMSPS